MYINLQTFVVSYFKSNHLLQLFFYYRKILPHIIISLFTLFIYYALWFLNPSNKLVALSLITLIPLYYWILKNFRWSLIFAYLASSIIFTGKRYVIELIPPGIFPVEIFPHGYVLFYIISANTLIGVLLAITLIRDMVTQPKKFQGQLGQPQNLMLFAYFTFKIFSDLIGSSMPNISLLFSVSSLLNLVLYLSIKILPKSKMNKFISIFLSIIAAQVVFQFTIAGQQYIAKSPIYKNIEAVVDIAYFGHVADEFQLRFRPIGTFDHANSLGMWLSFSLLLFIPHLIRRYNKVLIIITILGVITLTATISRSAWVGFLVGCLSILFFLEKQHRLRIPNVSRKLQILVMLICVPLLIFFVIPRVEKSIYTFFQGGGDLRRSQITETINLITQKPLWGTGTTLSVLAGYQFNPFGVFSRVALVIHNWYLLTAVENGIPALAIFLIFIVSNFQKVLSFVTTNKSYNNYNLFLLSTIGCVLCLLTVGFFQPFIGESLIIMTFGILNHEKL